MKIRSITFFLQPINPKQIELAGNFAKAARQAFESSGYQVQTRRLATKPFPEYLPSLDVDAVVEFAQQIEEEASAQELLDKYAGYKNDMLFDHHIERKED